MMPKELNKFAEDEAEKLKSEMEEWERFYVRFKPRLDELAGYEARIRDLETQLEEKDKMVKLNIEREKYKFALLTASYLIATLLFLRMITKFTNPWVFFGGGLLVGIGFAYLSRFWLNII